MKAAVRYIVAFLASLALFWIANTTYYDFRPPCADCFFHYGVPFAFVNQGGFVGGGGWMWKGTVADLVLVLVVGVAIVLYLRPRSVPRQKHAQRKLQIPMRPND